MKIRLRFLALGLLAFRYMAGSLIEVDLPMPDEAELQRQALEDTVRYLCERSLQLQEYSRSLKERSREINLRVRACLNSKNSGTGY